MDYLFAGYQFSRDAGLSYNGRAIVLPPKERELLAFLLRAKGKVMSKDDVVRAVWLGGIASDESVSRAVYRLRLAMQAAGGPPVVTTVYNGGFKISALIQEKYGAQGASTAALLRSRHMNLVVPLVISGREHAARQSGPDLGLALQAAQAAARVDPEYAWAWVAMGEFHIQQATRMLVPVREAGWQVTLACTKALALDPDCGPALAMRGWVSAMIDGDLGRGLHDVNAALRVDPDYWGTCLLSTWVLQAAADHVAAIDMARRARELNPYSMYVSAALPQQLMYAGRLDQAQEAALELVQVFPNTDTLQEVLSIILAAKGRSEEALTHAQRAADLSPHAPLMHGQLAYCLARLGRLNEARKVLDFMQASATPEPVLSSAPAYIALGQVPTALENLRSAKRLGVAQFHCARDDPRFAPVAANADFAELWRTR